MYVINGKIHALELNIKGIYENVEGLKEDVFCLVEVIKRLNKLLTGIKYPVILHAKNLETLNYKPLNLLSL